MSNLATIDITYEQQQGTLVDAVLFNAGHDVVRMTAESAIRNGEIDGISRDHTVSLSNYKIQPVPAKDGLPNRFLVTPKVAFG